MRSVRRVVLLALAAAAFVAATPVHPIAANAAHGGNLDQGLELFSNPVQAHPALSTAKPVLDEHDSGSLHAALMNKMDEHHRHPISPQHRAKAASFIQHLDHLVAGLRAKSHIAQLSRKYPGSRSAAENATLAHSEAELAREEAQANVEAEQAAVEEDEFGRVHGPIEHESVQQQPIHAPAGSKQSAHQARIQKRLNTKVSSAHIPSPSRPRTLPQTDPAHPMLEPVPEEHLVRRGHDSPQDDGYVLHPINLAPSSDYPSGVNFTTFVYPTVEGNVTIYVGITEYPLGKFHFFPSPRDEMDEISLVQKKKMRTQQQQERQARSAMKAHIFHAFLEERATLNPLCDGVAMTSESARAYNCLLAMNAGFFNMATDGCMGNVVSNDQFINHADAGLASHSHFGLTRKGNYITGYITPEEILNHPDGGFHELIQGSGWLIREGANYINSSASIEHIGTGFVTEKAPRNAIGHDKEGRLLMFEADGEEDIKLGLTLIEFADILMHHFQVENAINVDGGGSSTTVYKGEVADKPTCRDTPQICERPVTTISCVLP